MIIYDNKELAVLPEIINSIENIAQVENVELLEKIGGTDRMVFLAHLYGVNFSGLCLLVILPTSDLNNYIEKFPTSSQMLSLAGHLPEIQISYSNEHNIEKYVAIVLKIPSLEKGKPKQLSSLLTSPLIPSKTIIAQVHKLAQLLLKWNTSTDLAKRARHLTPLVAIKNHFLDNFDFSNVKIYNIDDTVNVIDVNGYGVLPNPLAYIKHPSLWTEYGIFPFPLGRVNGNLNSENILFQEEKMDVGPIILNWDNWQDGNTCVFLDFLTLELDIIKKLMPPVDTDIRGEWPQFLKSITDEILPTIPERGFTGYVVWNLIEPLRKACKSIIDDGLLNGIDFSNAFWLSMMVAGLRPLSQGSISRSDKLVGLLFSSYGLKKLLPVLQSRGKTTYIDIGELYFSSKFDSLSTPAPGSILLVGVGDYDLPIKPIPAAAQDALSLKGLFPKIGYDSNNIYCLTNESATVNDVDKSISLINKKFVGHPGEIFILYFSGHGINRDNDYYFLTYGSNIDNLESTALSLRKLLKKLTEINCEKRLLIFDCCHSGDVMSQALVNLPEKRFDEIVEGGNIVITSSGQYQKSYILPGRTNSLFTTCLIEAFTGNAYNTIFKNISVFDVFNYVTENVRIRAAKAGWKQTPKLGANVNRSFSIGNITHTHIE